MGKRGKSPKNVDIASKDVDKPVETVENFMQFGGCGKLIFAGRGVEKSKI